MNTVYSADSSYYAAYMNETTEKGPCLAMTPYGVIGLERVIPTLSPPPTNPLLGVVGENVDRCITPLFMIFFFIFLHNIKM